MHYKDGTQAMVGDLVKGTCYNTKGVIVGVMLGITPGATACNCRVGVLMQRPLGDNVLPYGSEASPHVAAVITGEGYAIVHREGAGADMRALLIGAKVDYSQCDHLELVHRPGAGTA